MKRFFIFIAAALLSVYNAMAQDPELGMFQPAEPFTYTESTELQKLLPSPAQTDSASYMMGVNWGIMLYNIGFEGMNPDEILSGLKDMLNAGGDLDASGNYKISPSEMASILDKYLQCLNDYKCARNKEAGKAYEEYYLKHHPSARRLSNGIVFNRLVPGRAATDHIREADTIVVNYSVSSIYGKVLDKGDKSSFAVKGTVDGFRYVIQGMSRDEVVEFVVPSDLAYGDRGSGNGTIEPGSTLVFKVELLSVRKENESGDNTGNWLY